MAAPTNYEGVVSSAIVRGAARPAASPIRHRFLAGQGQQPAAPARPQAPDGTAGQPAPTAAPAAPARRKLNLCLPTALYRRMRVRSLDLLVEGRPRTEASMSAIVAPALDALLDELGSGWEPGEGLPAAEEGEGRKYVSVYLPEGTHSRLRRTAVDRACRHLPYSTCLDLVSLAILRHVPEEGEANPPRGFTGPQLTGVPVHGHDAPQGVSVKALLANAWRGGACTAGPAAHALFSVLGGLRSCNHSSGINGSTARHVLRQVCHSKRLHTFCGSFYMYCSWSCMNVRRSVFPT